MGPKRVLTSLVAVPVTATVARPPGWRGVEAYGPAILMGVWPQAQLRSCGELSERLVP
jgi:hypothetical protein